jgi:hypothetical protein
MFGEIGVTLAGGGDPLPELNRHSLLDVLVSIEIIQSRQLGRR